MLNLGKTIITIALSLTFAASVPGTGTIMVIAEANPARRTQIYGLGTQFTTQVQVGKYIVTDPAPLDGSVLCFKVVSIQTNDLMVSDRPLPENLGELTYHIQSNRCDHPHRVGKESAIDTND